jgi:hypothetical protein
MLLAGIPDLFVADLAPTAIIHGLKAYTVPKDSKNSLFKHGM